MKNKRVCTCKCFMFRASYEGGKRYDCKRCGHLKSEHDGEYYECTVDLDKEEKETKHVPT